MENSMLNTTERDGEVYVDKLDAMDLLGIPPHPEIGTLLEGIFGNGPGVRLKMVQQMERERVLGRLVSRGPNFDAYLCDCTDNPVWCSKKDRGAFLYKAVHSLVVGDGSAMPDSAVEMVKMGDAGAMVSVPMCPFAPEELMWHIRMQSPNSCLGNQLCFELAFTQKVILRKFVRVDDYRFRPGGARDLPAFSTPKRNAAEIRERVMVSNEAYPKVNHYKDPTTFD